MPVCPCEKPELSGGGSYYCEMFGCDMFPHFCEKIRSDRKVRAIYMRGVGPMQMVLKRPEDIAAIRAARKPPKPERPPHAGKVVPRVPGCLPGTELTRILSRFGVRPKGCACKARARLMDQNGPDWCRKNISKIAGWLLGEARKRNWKLATVSRPAIKVLIRWAIRRSERRQAE